MKRWVIIVLLAVAAQGQDAPLGYEYPGGQALLVQAMQPHAEDPPLAIVGTALEEAREPTPAPPKPLSPREQYLATIAAIAPYNRHDWRFIDADHDCQTTRTEVLLEESQGRACYDDSSCDKPKVEYADPRECRVVRGTWVEPYAGTTTNTADDLDIDHLVPVKNVWESGGWAWSEEQKLAYANDLDNPNVLLAVPKALNRAKGAKTPDQWKPPRREIWCWYALAWMETKSRYGLTLTVPEAKALMEMLGTCG